MPGDGVPVLSPKQARDKMIVDNMRLAEFVVERIIKYNRNFGAFRDDMFQAACIGLIRAVDKYDPTIAKFSTYAYPWCHVMAMKCAAECYNNVRVPNRRREGGQDLNGNMSLDAMSQDNEIDEWPVNNGYGQKWIDLHKNEYDMEEDVETRQVLRSFIDSLPEFAESSSLNGKQWERDVDLVLARMGGATLEEAGRKHNISRERVRQIESVILGRINKWVEDQGIELEAIQ